MTQLTRNEENLLIAIYKLGDDAYGVTIRKFLLENSGKDWNYGTLYNSLDQLVKKELSVKTESEPTQERGGRRKIHYKICRKGIQALHESLSIHNRVWDGITQDILKGEIL